MTDRPHAHLMVEIERKELGPLYHFLDGVWRHLPVTAAGAVGAAVIAAAAVSGQILLYTMAGSMLTLQVAAGARGLHQWHMAERRKRLYDGRRCQTYLRGLEARACGAVASQRGTVWIVTDYADDDPTYRVRILSEAEYSSFRAQEIASGRSLDEVRVSPRREAPSIRHATTRRGRELTARDIDMSQDMSTSGRIDRWLHHRAPQ